MAGHGNQALRNELLQLIPSGVGIFDLTGDVVRLEYLNDGYYQMIGASRAQRSRYTGVNTTAAIHERDLPGLLEEAKASIREGRTFRFRFRLLDGEGRYRWVGLRANHVPLPDGAERFYASYYDIDEIMQTQAQLRDNELAFRDMLRYSDTAHFIYYPDRRRHECLVMPEKLRELPMSLDDYPESFIRLAVDPEDAEAYREMIRKIDAGQRESECAIRILYQGRRMWYRVHYLCVLDDDGHPFKAIGYAVNIDTFKEAERAFQEEKLRMRSLESDVLAVSCFNVTQDRNVDLNNDDNLRYQKPRSAGIFEEGARADPRIARQAPDTLSVLLCAAEQIPDPSQRDRFLQTCSHAGLMDLYESGQREAVLEYRRRTGRGLIWVSTHITILPDPETGDVLAFFYTTDINDRIIYRKLTGRILEKNYETVSYYDPSTGNLYLKPDNDLDAISFLPVPYSSAVEDAVARFVAPEEAAEVREKFALRNILSALETAEIHSIYYTGLQRDESLPGAPRKRMKCDTFYLDGSRDIIVFLQVNATAIFEQEREHREKMGKALQAAESANRAKTEFVSRISHDIRTPISIISNMTEFALADLRDEEALKKDLSRIKSADAFLLSLINDVLDISKIDSGKIEFELGPYFYAEHYANLRNLLEPMCEAKGIKCVISRKRENHGVIVVDRTRLNQIALNLLSNAVKYTPPGGTVTYIADSEDLPDNKVRFGFEIRDTGIGMSPEFQKHMFEPFSQEYDNPLRPKGMTGTGLGLSIVKRMVDLMGGTISVESAPGKGTTVRCSIVFPDATRDPRYQDMLRPAPQPTASQPPLSGKVLLAEDNAINTEIALRLLEEMGLQADCAENGAQAVERFRASLPGEYRAVLMDIQMPLLTGYEATERIRALPRPDARIIPIIAMTADAFSDAEARGRRAGMNGYVLKPLDPRRLRAILEKAVSAGA